MTQKEFLPFGIEPQEYFKIFENTCDREGLLELVIHGDALIRLRRVSISESDSLYQVEQHGYEIANIKISKEGVCIDARADDRYNDLTNIKKALENKIGYGLTHQPVRIEVSAA